MVPRTGVNQTRVRVRNLLVSFSRHRPLRPSVALRAMLHRTRGIEVPIEESAGDPPGMQQSKEITIEASRYIWMQLKVKAFTCPT